MGVKSEHEEECEVMGVPEGLEALVTNLVVGGRVHYEHDKQHEVASDATGLFVVDVLRGKLADLCIGLPGIRRKEYPEGVKKTHTSPLDIDEVDIVGRSVNHGPEGH